MKAIPIVVLIALCICFLFGCIQKTEVTSEETNKFAFSLDEINSFGFDFKHEAQMSKTINTLNQVIDYKQIFGVYNGISEGKDSLLYNLYVANDEESAEEGYNALSAMLLSEEHANGATIAEIETHVIGDKTKILKIEKSEERYSVSYWLFFKKGKYYANIIVFPVYEKIGSETAIEIAKAVERKIENELNKDSKS